MTMTIINPTTLTDAMLVSSTAPENDYTAWNAGTSYVVGDKVIRTGVHKIFENLIAGINATVPESLPARWLDLGATNRWKMFDKKVGTTTTLASPLEVLINPGSIGGIALMELTGTQVVITLKDSPGGATVYTATIALDGTIILSFYDWFFEDYVQRTDLTLTDLPEQYQSGQLTITLTGVTVACGVCFFGRPIAIGGTQYGATVGIISYSKKETDAFGNTVVTKRANSKRNSLKIMTEKSRFNKIFRALTALDSVPCVYIATTADGYEPMIVYGFYRDFSIDVSYPEHHLCNLEVEGII